MTTTLERSIRQFETEQSYIEKRAKKNILLSLQRQSIIQFFLNDQFQQLQLLSYSNDREEAEAVLSASLDMVNHLYRVFQSLGLIKFDSTDTFPKEVCFDSEPTAETHQQFIEDVEYQLRRYS